MDIQSLTPLEKVEALQNVMLAKATGEYVEERDYLILRRERLNDEDFRLRLPRFLRTCRDLGQFWQFIKTKFAHYKQRRQFIWDEFRPCLEYLEGLDASPSSTMTSDALATVSSAHVQTAWNRALERLKKDPEGAITSARTLLESVCKHILDEKRIAYDDHADLPKLYGVVASALNLAPSQHSEKVFKQILGGCHSIVEGLGALRNRLGDAHGKGKSAAVPAARHAALTVNLAGSMATFLIETSEANRR